jgi:hypothetical protein
MLGHDPEKWNRFSGKIMPHQIARAAIESAAFRPADEIEEKPRWIGSKAKTP